MRGCRPEKAIQIENVTDDDVTRLLGNGQLLRCVPEISLILKVEGDPGHEDGGGNEGHEGADRPAYRCHDPFGIKIEEEE